MILSKPDNSFRKPERLCSEKRIGALFSSDTSFISYPYRIVYNMQVPDAEPNVSVLITVPKKKFKRAVKRNRIKRLTRESYRLNKGLFKEVVGSLNKSVDIAFIYLSTDVLPYAEIEKSVQKAAVILKDKVGE